MKLYQQLEQTFKMRINSNGEIIPYIKKLSEMGKFDEPKKIAAIAIILDRLGSMEDEKDIQDSLQEMTTQMNQAKERIDATVLQTTDSPMDGLNDIVEDITTNAS